LAPANKDYYRLLQVSPSADQTTIKKAYRKMAVLWHPDRNPDSTVAEERFKSIAEAYAVLGDPVKRHRYDQMGPEAFFGEFSTDDIFQGFDLSDLFKEFGLAPIKETLFSIIDKDATPTVKSVPYQDFFSEFGQKNTPRKTPGKPPTINVTVAVTLKEAVFGAIKVAAYNSSSEVVRFYVTVPQGAHQGQVLIIPKKPGRLGQPRNELTVTLNVLPDPAFQRLGHDLHTSLTLTSAELAMGCRPMVPTLDGSRLRLTVPPGTHSGQKFKAAGHGVPGLDGRRGDLLILVTQSTAG
jgi:DnaJ-class molecular chaperone